jgi:hypothetical protein
MFGSPFTYFLVCTSSLPEMGSVSTALEFLADLPIYKTEQPYQVIPSPDWPEIDRNSLSNIKLQQDSVTIHDLRDQSEQFTLDTAGFEYMRKQPRSLDFSSAEALELYNRETEDFLKTHFGAVFVRCFARVVSTEHDRFFALTAERRFEKAADMIPKL